MNEVLSRLRQRPVRGVAVGLSLCVAAYFIWAAWTDARTPGLAWAGIVAVQCLNAAVLLTERRSGP